METNNREYLSELVTGFADGELTPQEELILKLEMNSDPSLMDEMKHHILVKDAVKKDIEAFTPPAEAVKGIFSALGYSSPYANKPPVKKSWFPLFRRASVLALLLIGAFVGFDLINNESTDNINSELTTNKVEKNISNTENEINSKVETIPVVNSSEVKEIKAVKAESNNQTRKSVNFAKIINSINRENEISIENTIVENQPEAVLNENIETTQDKVNVNNIDYSNYYSNRPNNLPISNENSGIGNTITNISNYKFSFINDSEYKIYIKGYQTPQDMFSSMSLGVLFLSKYNFKGGFEVGQQNYSVLVSDANDINILPENRDIFWYAATVRYDAKDISFAKMTPYAQFAIGSGNFGKYMARYSIGIEYAPFESGIGINIGYEGSNLWYSTQNNPYSASLNGYIFGLSWKF